MNNKNKLYSQAITNQKINVTNIGIHLLDNELTF